MPWVEESESPVEWLFDKPRPDIASRMVQKMSGSPVLGVLGEQDKGAKRTASAAGGGAQGPAKRQKTSSAVDGFRLCAEHVVPPTCFNRPTTYADVVLVSAKHVINLVDTEFSGAATDNMLLDLTGPLVESENERAVI